MEKIILNGAVMLTCAQAHEEIALKLNFPDYYGNNLDALWDMLSTMEADVVLMNTAQMCISLGDYGSRLLETFGEAAQENPSFRFAIEA